MVACVLGAYPSHDWSTHDSSLGAFGSPLHDGSLLEVFGLLVHESTHDDGFHPDAEQSKGIGRRTRCNKQDPHQDGTTLGVNEPIPAKNLSVYEALRGLSTALDSIQRRSGEVARTAWKILGQCWSGFPPPRSIPG